MRERAEGGVVPTPGAVPPPAVAMRMPRIIAKTRRLYDAGAHLILGTAAGIGPPKPDHVLPLALEQTAMICLPPEAALNLAPRRPPPRAASATPRDDSHPGSTPTSWP